MKKNNSWNIRRLVDESFVPATQCIILKIVGFLYSQISKDMYFYLLIYDKVGFFEAHDWEPNMIVHFKKMFYQTFSSGFFLQKFITMRNFKNGILTWLDIIKYPL